MVSRGSSVARIGEPAPNCVSCDGQLIATEVDTRLYVRRSDNSTKAAWSTTRLLAWTCLSCGRTEFYAAEPDRLAE